MTWMIALKDQSETLSLFKWEAEKLQNLGDFSPEEIALQTLQAPVSAFFPSEHVSFVEALLPKTSDKRLRLALPSLIEEHIASAPEENFYALPQIYTPGEQCTLAVVASTYLDDKLSACQRAGINIQSFSPDCFLLPNAQEGMTKMIQEDRVIVRKGALQGFALQQQHAVLIMKELESLPVSEPGLYEIPPFNFLQAQYKPKPLRQSLGRLQWVYMFLSLTLFLHLFSLIIMGSILKGRLTTLQEQTLGLYVKVFPGATAVTSPKSLIERELQNRGTQAANPLLNLLAPLSAALSQISGATLQSLEYQGTRLMVHLSLPSLEAVDQLNQILSQSGTPAVEQQVNEESNHINVQFSLTQGEG